MESCILIIMNAVFPTTKIQNGGRAPGYPEGAQGGLDLEGVVHGEVCGSHKGAGFTPVKFTVEEKDPLTFLCGCK